MLTPSSSVSLSLSLCLSGARSPSSFRLEITSLKLRGAEQTYGHQHGGREVFFSRPRDDSLFPGVSFFEDKVESLDDVLGSHAFPDLPRDRGVHLHWLAVSGTKPLIPENVRVKRRRKNEEAPGALGAELEDGGKAAGGGGGGGSGGEGEDQDWVSSGNRATVLEAYETNVGKGSRHVVSAELRSYFKTVTEAVLGTSSSADTREGSQEEGAMAAGGSADGDRGRLVSVLSSLSRDPGLQPLLPYFCAFVLRCCGSQGTKKVFTSLRACDDLLALVSALVDNPHLTWERHLDQVLPVVITFLVRKTLGGPGEDHWATRREAARVLKRMCAKLGAEGSRAALQTRVARTLTTGGLSDASRALTTHYGAVVGCRALGDAVCENVLLPRISTYMPLLGEALTPQNMNPLQQYEAYQVLEALLGAVGGLVHRSEYNAVLGSFRCKGRSGEEILAARASDFRAPEPKPLEEAPAGETAATAFNVRPSKVMSVKELGSSGRGRRVLEWFDVREPGGGGIEQAEGEGAAQGLEVGLSFDLEVNNFALMPTFERGNIVVHTFDVFGEHVLPFLSSDLVATTL